MCLYVTVGRHHRDGWAEQTYSHLPGLPRNGTQPEQLATVGMDPAPGCTEGLDWTAALDRVKMTTGATRPIRFQIQIFTFCFTVKPACIHLLYLLFPERLILCFRCTWNCVSRWETATPFPGCLAPVRKPSTCFTCRRTSHCLQGHGFVLATTPRWVPGCASC